MLKFSPRIAVVQTACVACKYHYSSVCLYRLIIFTRYSGAKALYSNETYSSSTLLSPANHEAYFTKGEPASRTLL